MPECTVQLRGEAKANGCETGRNVSSTSFHLDMLLGFTIAYDDAYDRQQTRREKSIITLDNRF